MVDRLVELPLLAYANARSLHFIAQYRLMALASMLLPGGIRPDPQAPLQELIAEKDRLFARDIANMRQGVYPLDVLAPESPLSHAARLPHLVADGVVMSLRRALKQTAAFDDQAKAYAADLPKYYLRNFHHQTNGYLSETSAELYEHQVEMLFGGMADAMRRLVIAPMKEAFGRTDGQGLTFLELGAGTGRATRFVRLAFPQAKIVAVDLSHPYLKVAQRNLASFSRIDFLQADAAKLPFTDGQFDAVYSVFLFHELPLNVRQAVMAESRRVLKPGGFLGAVDSLQKGDRPSFDAMLKRFPTDYHEPFYPNYLQHPLPGLMAEPRGAAGADDGPGVHSDLGGLAKVCWTRKRA
jgi:ubiquinone/menaquinone biosynthesis C-methylase UbiE